MKRVAILGSGNGSNFEAIVQNLKNDDIKFLCISNIQDAFILKRAKRLGVKEHYVPFDETYDFLAKQKFDLFVLAGYMRILPSEVLKLGTFINIHPSLLPKYKGKEAIKRAFEDKEEYTGVTIHYVTDELDSGPIIEQERIVIPPSITLEELTNTVHSIEHKLYSKVIKDLIYN